MTLNDKFNNMVKEIKDFITDLILYRKPITANELKGKLQEIYNRYGFDKKAACTDILTYGFKISRSKVKGVNIIWISLQSQK